MVSMEKLSHYGPSISVKFYKGWVIAAYGPFIHVYNYHTGEQLNISRVFKRNKVHGIAIKDHKLLAYGARSMAVVPLDLLLASKDVSSLERMCNEWIIAGEFNFDASTVFLLTSYNKVLCCNDQGEIRWVKAVYGERSILYSGSISVFSDTKVYINAGTVMGGVFIWDLFSETKVHNLLGHEGSIFYVTLSKNGEYVASCSDDRSIKLWNLKSGELLSTGWGHTARIWQLKFIDNDTKVVSVSEDCTCRVWDIVKPHDDLVQSGIYEVHLIKNVWGVDVEEDEMLAVTSGNDGRLKLTDLKPLCRKGDEVEVFSLQDISSGKIDLEKNEIIKGFYWLSFGLVAITSVGQIIKFDQKSSQWSVVMKDSRFSSYSVTSGIQELNTVIFSSNKCDLLLLKFTEDGNSVLVNRFINIDSLSKTTNLLVAYRGGQIFVTLESPNPRDPFMCFELDPNQLEVIKQFQFIKPSNFVSSCLEICENYILVGSRFSSIAIYDLQHPEKEAHVIRKISPGDTTTSIRLIENSKNEALFSVTNRDGFYNFIAVDFLSDCKHKIVHSNKVTRGFLEGAYYNKEGDYLTYGFKSNAFYIYNETKQYEIMNELCGGAHRQWQLLPIGTDEELILVYVKASSLHFRRIYKQVVPYTLNDGTHGREIRDITIQPGTGDFQNGYLFCTASEDTTIKLSHVCKNSGKVTNLWTQRKHVSGLQRCKFLNKELMISSSAREELFLWEISDEFNSKPYISTKQTLPTSSNNPDLRIMDFDFKFVQNSKDFILATVYSDSAIKIWRYRSGNNQFELLIEGRYETCCLLNVKLISLAGKIFLLVSPTDGHLVHWDITGLLPYEVDGSCLIDNQLDTVKVGLPVYSDRFAVHQSGIKAFETTVTKDNGIKVYTGGDDNGLGISNFKLDEEGRLFGQVVSFETCAASSTITSLNLVNEGSELLVTSVDQNIRVWDVSEDKLILKAKKYTTNADTGSSDVIQTNNSESIALIGGVGLSVWKLAK